MTTTDEPTTPLPIRYDASRLVRNVILGGLGAGLLLVLADGFVNFGGLASRDSVRRLFNITREDGLANWYSSTLLLACAVTLWFIQSLARRLALATGRSHRRWGWVALAVFFGWMALDDAGALHEKLGTAFEGLIGKDAGAGGILTGFKSYTWQLLFVPLFAAFGLFMLRFFWTEFRGDKLKLLTFIALTCWVTAVGLDYIEGLHPNPVYDKVQEITSLRTKTIEHFSKSLEEFIEMTGATIFLAVFLRKLARLADRVTLHFE